MDYVLFIDVDTEMEVATIHHPIVLPKGGQYITFSGEQYKCMSDPEFFYHRFNAQGSDMRMIYLAHINVRKMST